MTSPNDRWITSPSGKNFSNIREDPFNAEKMEIALGKLQIGKPANAQFQLPETAEKTFDPFVSITPPDIVKNTRIIAVCGIEPETSSPQKDGWFLSDFCAFWHLLQGLTEHQQWLHCLDLKTLVRTHTYAHGDPFDTRKIVLNEPILKTMLESKHPPTRVSPASLSMRFTSAVKSAVKAAEESKENVLVIILAHGMDDKDGLCIGEIIPGKHGRGRWSTTQLRRAIPSNNANVMVMTSACFSGGWICNPAFNITAFTAASGSFPSRSHTFSGSCGRASGSLWASTVIDSITRDPITLEDLWEQVEEATEEQEATFAQFSYQCQESLLTKLDRRGYRHHFVFSAQDDNWEAAWRTRTGFPLGEYKERWDSLPILGADQTLHPGDPINRAVDVSDAVRDEYTATRKKELAGLADIFEPRTTQFSATRSSTTATTILGKRKSMYGGSNQSYLNVLKDCARSYMASFPGCFEGANNIIMFYQIRQLFADGLDPQEQEKLFLELEYRFQDMDLGDRYVRAMGIPPPKGRACHEFDFNDYQECNHSSTKYNQISKLIGDAGRLLLFPAPNHKQGRYTQKGEVYLIAAIDFAKIPLEEAEAKLTHLVAENNKCIELSKSVLKKDAEVVSKRQKLYQAFGIKPDNWSPKKQIARMRSKGKGDSIIKSPSKGKSKELGQD